MEKADIGPSLAACLLETQFPEWADLPITPVELDGWDNTTFRLGDNMSVRLPSGEPYSAQVDKEHRWLPVLAKHLPVAIPQPLALGAPGCGYPWPWSVYRWLPGDHATVDRIANISEFARALGEFLVVLQSIDPSGGPTAGADTQNRGAPLAVWDSWTRKTITDIADEIDTELVTQAWDSALAGSWKGRPKWFHGDITPSNLLVLDGRLSAVIDFGCSGIGDPACDLAIAWTFFTGESRRVFQETVPADRAAWQRGRGWALWKALVTHAEAFRLNPQDTGSAGARFGWRRPAREVVDEVVSDCDVQG